MDIVDAYYKTKIAGDAKDEPAKDEPKKEDPKEEPKKEEPKEEPKAQNGDAVDYYRIAEMIGDSMEKALAKKVEKVAGDDRIAKMIGDAVKKALAKKEEEVAGDEAQVKEFNIAIHGDAEKSVTSDDVLKNIF